jgi:hypothetical protein
MGAALASQLGNMGGMAALAGGSLGIKNPNDTTRGISPMRARPSRGTRLWTPVARTG